MLSLLSQYSKERTAWFLLSLSTIALEVTALHFQHGVGLTPCTLCIYQRIALLGILFSSILALFSPKSLIVRIMAVAFWLYSSFEGFMFSLQNARLQFEPSITDSCAINAEFPAWLPLNEWIPSFFNAEGLCSEKLWSFLTIEMSQWMLIIFACYFIVGLLVLIAQFFSPSKQTIWN